MNLLTGNGCSASGVKMVWLFESMLGGDRGSGVVALLLFLFCLSVCVVLYLLLLTQAFSAHPSMCFPLSLFSLFVTLLSLNQPLKSNRNLLNWIEISLATTAIFIYVCVCICFANNRVQSTAATIILIYNNKQWAKFNTQMFQDHTNNMNFELRCPNERNETNKMWMKWQQRQCPLVCVLTSTCNGKNQTSSINNCAHINSNMSEMCVLYIERKCLFCCSFFSSSFCLAVCVFFLLLILSFDYM